MNKWKLPLFRSEAKITNRNKGALLRIIGAMKIFVVNVDIAHIFAFMHRHLSVTLSLNKISLVDGWTECIIEVASFLRISTFTLIFTLVNIIEKLNLISQTFLAFCE